jgi:predicted ABC-type ATPase
MQKNKRLRIFAGPNGSGKSTLFKEFKNKYDPGVFINADELEKQLSSTGFIDLAEVGLKVSDKELENFKKTKEAKSLLKKAQEEGSIINIELKDNFIVDKAKDTHSYEAAFTAAFIRHLLTKDNKSYSFETVMSHLSKLEEIKEANKLGYKTYLYFVCTDNSEINISRVENRVEKGGHDVDPEKIKSRYQNTLNNLADAIQLVYRAYLFDNSKNLKLIAEVFEGESIQLHKTNLPEWFNIYVLKKFGIE